MAQAKTPTYNERISPGRMTWEEYLEWCSEDNDAEWVDGEIVWLSPVALDSGDITHFISVLLRHYVEHHDLGSVFVERILMRLATRPSGREPDILFVAKERRSIHRKKYIDGPADLAVEVVAEESRVRDRQIKFQEYERAGVREYWIIDPDKKQADFYQLDATGRYQAVPPDSEHVYHSAVLEGFWLKVDWLWQSPLPPVMSVLREWKIV